MSNKDIAKTANWLRKHKIICRLSIVLIVLFLTVIIAGYAASALYNKNGSFTVSVKKLEMIKYGITLSESPTKYTQLAKLNADYLEEADAYKADWIDEIEEIDETNGSHNGKDYMAYTFYCINSGDEYVLTYSYSLIIKHVKNNLDEAIRFKVLINGVDTGIYGKQDKNGKTPLRDYEKNLSYDAFGNKIYWDVPENRINKFSSNKVLYGEIDNLKPKEYTKFTIIMWIEGTDPDCTNDLLGGTIRVDFNMSVLKASPLD